MVERGHFGNQLQERACLLFPSSGNTLHSKRKLICCRVFVATMAARFVEADEELIELLKEKVKIKAQTTEQEFLKSERKLGGKRNSLKVTKSQN